MIPPVFLAFALAVLSPAALAQPKQDQANKPVTTADDAENFDLLMQRFRQKHAIQVPGTPPPQGGPATLATAQQAEMARSAEFDRQYGRGSYEGIVRLESHCYSADGCDKLATAGIINGAYKFVDLQKDVQAKTLKPDTPPYHDRHQQIKEGIRSNLDSLQPTPEASPAYRKEVVVTKPVVSKILAPEELKSYP
ncbi:MAG: hypothetical protein NTX64_02860, partial [Elusimicrobia bacterium]|nr:hypothetical protein [Elusimicrobiota bacterium]